MYAKFYRALLLTVICGVMGMGILVDSGISGKKPDFTDALGNQKCESCRYKKVKNKSKYAPLYYTVECKSCYRGTQRNRRPYELKIPCSRDKKTGCALWRCSYSVDEGNGDLTCKNRLGEIARDDSVTRR